jgi:hypothetical protein
MALRLNVNNYYDASIMYDAVTAFCIKTSQEYHAKSIAAYQQGDADEGMQWYNMAKEVQRSCTRTKARLEIIMKMF